MPAGVAIVLVRSDFGGGTGVGAESQSADGLAVGGPSTTSERDLIALSSISRQSTSTLTTSRSLVRKLSMRVLDRERSEFTMTKRFAIVLNVMPWYPLNRRQDRLMYALMSSPWICLRVYRAEMLSISASFLLGLYLSRIRPHILKPSRSYAGLCKKMLRTLSGIRPDMSRRRRREIWCLVPGRVFVKSVTPAKEGISNQVQMRACNMGKESRSLFQALRKKLSEGEVWCPPVGLVGVGAVEGAGGLDAMEATLPARVA